MEDVPLNDAGKKPVRKNAIPRADTDFGKVAKEVSAAWSDNNWLTLQYITAAQFATKASEYNSILTARKSEGGTRPQVTAQLDALNKEINGSAAIVKDYINEKFRNKNPESYFPSFGFEGRTKSHNLPRDQDSREAALVLMVKAIEDNDLQDRTYGLDYWTEISSQFVDLIKQARDLDGGISDKVGDKNVLKKEIQKVLTSIVNVMKGNFPDTYKQELRKWGMQKEKY